MVKDRKRDILNAAVCLFSHKGYLKTSMLDIADRIGLTKGGIYHHIDKKEDLLVMIHNEMADAFVDNFRKVVESELDLQEKLVAGIKIHVQIMRDYKDHIKVFFTEMDNIDDSESFQQLVSKRDKAFRMIKDNIVSGIKEGIFRSDLDPIILTLLLFGSINWFYQWYRPDGELTAEEIAEIIKKLVFHGILKKNLGEE